MYSPASLVCQETAEKEDRTSSPRVPANDYPHNCYDKTLHPMRRNPLSFSDPLCCPPCCEILCFAHSFMYQFPMTTLSKHDWDSKIKGSETKIWEERFGLLPMVSHVLHLSSWKTATLCHKFRLLVDLPNSSYSFFYSDDSLIFYKAFLLHGDCFGMIFRQKILPPAIIFAATLQHPTHRLLQQQNCSKDSKKWNCQIPFHFKEQQTFISP